jgi:hypothetical protein
MTYLSIIEASLKEGAKLRIFRSGGGLRVARVERARTLIGYGEGPVVEEALDYAAEELKARRSVNRDFLYLTGSSTPSSELDTHFLRGGKLKARYQGGWYFVAISCVGDDRIPEWLEARLREGETVRWCSPRGFIYVAGPCVFANGSMGSFTSCEYKPVLRRPYDYPAQKKGMGLTLAEAIDLAMKEPPEELIDEEF